MRYASVAAFAVLFLAAASNARAQVYATGPGMNTCGEFAQQYGANPLIEGVYFAWAAGWLTGLNSSEGRKRGKSRVMFDLESKPIEYQMLVIREYCNSHPLAMYVQAVVSMRDSSLTKVSLPPLPAS